MKKIITIFLLPFILLGCSYLWEVPFTNSYEQSIKVIWLQADGYGQSTIESDSLRPGQTKEIDTPIWRTHTRSNFQFQMFHVVNAKNDTVETVFLNSGLIAWLGYNIDLPLSNVPDQPNNRYKSFLKYCNGDPLSNTAVELFVDFINGEFEKVLKRSDQLLAKHSSPSKEAKEEFENMAEDIDSANLQAIMLLQILASEKQGSERVTEKVDMLKSVFPEVFEHYRNQHPFNKIFESVSSAST
jgi:hypothetical protein